VFLWEDFECTVLNGVCCGLSACSVFWYCCIVSWVFLVLGGAGLACKLCRVLMFVCESFWCGWGLVCVVCGCE